MKLKKIIDSMYQNKMCSMEEKTNEGVTIHLGTKVDFTKEEEASVILLRELQILRGKANKYDSLVHKLEKDIDKADSIINDEEYRYIQEVLDEQYERKKYAQEILEIVKGEKDDSKF